MDEDFDSNPKAACILKNTSGLALKRMKSLACFPLYVLLRFSLSYLQLSLCYNYATLGIFWSSHHSAALYREKPPN